MEISSGVVALILCALSAIAIEALAAASKGVGGLAPLVKCLRLPMPSFDVSFGKLFKAMLAVGVFGLLAMIVVSAIQQVNTNPPPAKSSMSKSQASLAPIPTKKCTVSCEKPPDVKGFTDLRTKSYRGEVTDSGSFLGIEVFNPVSGIRSSFHWDRNTQLGYWLQSDQPGYIGYWRIDARPSVKEYTGRMTGLIKDAGQRARRLDQFNEHQWATLRIVLE